MEAPRVPREVKLKDVAAQAGVSIKTVSNVVNGYAFVSDETRRRVQAALDDLGYRPNLAARYLRRSHMGVIALAIPHFGISYFIELADAITAAAEGHGYAVLLDQTRGQHTYETLLFRGLRPMLIDGAILNPLSLRPQELNPRTVGMPIVLIGERPYEGLHDHVLIDNVAAAADATRHLIALGRRRIAALGIGQGGQHGETVRLRYTGFARAMQEAGLPVSRRWLVPGTYQRHEGAQAARLLLERGMRPDAIFCFNDMVALGAMRALHEVGLRVPDDVAVAGIDDVEEGRYSTPSLTTISPDKERIARLAVDFLIGRIKGTRTVPAERIEVDYRLIVRESTAGRR